MNTSRAPDDRQRAGMGEKRLLRAVAQEVYSQPTAHPVEAICPSSLPRSARLHDLHGAFQLLSATLSGDPLIISAHTVVEHVEAPPDPSEGASVTTSRPPLCSAVARRVYSGAAPPAALRLVRVPLRRRR